MRPSRQVLFIQGGGVGVHDGWDRNLVDNLSHNLGPGYRVHYPRMPREDDPSYATWNEAIRDELATLGESAVVAGHSVGGTILMATIADRPPERGLRSIVLISAPFVGAGGWPGDGFEFSDDLGARLPPETSVHLFHGLDDQVVPASHVDLYARAIPQARVHRLPGRDHQLDDDLGEVANTIAADHR